MSGIGGSVEQMTQGHLRNVQQLAVFYTGHNNIYAINIAKVKAFIITEEVAINDTPKDTNIIAGIATIRGEPVTLINLDAWLGLKPFDTKEYKLIIFCEFNHKKIGFLVKDMLDIVEKTTQELRNTEETNSKITYTTYVKVNNKDELCTVFNAEQLLRDIKWTDDGGRDIKKYVEGKIHSSKKILAAEDSAVAREVLHKFFSQIEVEYEIYPNGAELIDRLEELDPEKVGLVITDIEMPGTDGYQVASFIKNNSKYEHIPVVVNSSMTTDAVKGKMTQIGIDGFVGKTDINALYNITNKLLLR
ncbi:chemotaxis protein CheV [Aliarcobacter cryaerophilus]|jgi:two-component system, chemotaxis family, chemotaxis protein CheV|uniref:Chemotaxis protein CheV n=4 Tax=Arcobacteraceae TaxID=2808963 RepID=A0A2S9TQU5_9BACT|nr:chemotaxis protein CheW [Aliarcobacter cryaerophilus]WNL28424.1 chemotaxis protein CheW [Arcobacter sp. AZ-2023]WPD06481.1 chemotaxis protein CheW [Arcobacter sp. DSM 115956]WPD08572.1 chemotaxis protein CheW [Arcobacter sp. DSM 115955]AYJ77734.1 chemotaxis signal transduction protein CheV [Aliarcobacter cryaerophilus D2610]MCT7466509.1 chemotaxis protein CheW [Aliarcobacter cryaerophilus]